MKNNVRKKILIILLALSCACNLGACTKDESKSVAEQTETPQQTESESKTEEQTDISDVDEVDYKPVIYLYPETTTDVTVKLDYSGDLTCTYPKYEDGWTVTAEPDGTLTDESGQTYNYLYWEGINNVAYDFSQGFCVAGSDTATFLENALAQLGLNRREANEFIVYWLPRMEANPYNLIAFQTDVYTEAAQLSITPAPDTLIRVFMAWKPLDEPEEIPAQNLITPERTGFTVIEWGGSELTEGRG